jgi:hypothetical protein
MATFTAGRSAKVHVNGYDLSEYLKTASTNASADTADASAFGDAAKVYVPLQRDATFQADGMHQSGTATIDGVLSTALGVDGAEVTHFPAGDAIGASGYALQGIDTSHDVSSPVDDVVKCSMSLQSVVGVEIVTSHRAWASGTAAGTATTVDGAVATTTGRLGYLHAQVTGGTLTVKIQDSADDSTYADIVSFTAVSGTASERIAAAGTTRRYTRAVWTLNGGTAYFQASAGRTPKL